MGKDHLQPGIPGSVLAWLPRNFHFDELDPDSACIPYQPASIELPARCWGKTVRVEGRLIPPGLPYRPRWQPPERIKAFERRWQAFVRKVGLSTWAARWQGRMAAWPRLSSPPALEMSLNGAPLVRHAPGAGEFVATADLPPRPADRETFRLGFRLRRVAVAEVLAWIATRLKGAPLPMALWTRMRDWQFRTLQHRRLRLTAVLIDNELIVDFREHAAVPGPVPRQAMRPGLNVIGHFLSEHSFGEAARGSVRAADAAGIPVCLLRLKTPFDNRQNDESVRARLCDQMVHPVSLYYAFLREADEIEKYHGAGWMGGRRNIAFWAWETPDFPERLIRQARHFDEIWAPSDFVRDAVQIRVPIPVVTMPLVIEFAPPAGGGLRAKFGLPENLFLYLFVLDLNSAPRKNPEAVLAAFSSVIARNSAVGLVLKVHNSARNPEELVKLTEAAKGVPNVFIIDRTLSRHDVYGLMASCDAFVSLHHAEGFGLCVAEAMYLGKPVVSTDWSATAEYVTAQNGCPVRCRLVALEKHIEEYVRGSVWAEPDVEHAAWSMEKLAADPQLCAALGARAAQDIRARFSAAAIGRRYAQRLDSILFW